MKYFKYEFEFEFIFLFRFKMIQLNDLNKILLSFLTILFVYCVKKYFSRSRTTIVRTESKSETSFVELQLQRENLLQQKLSQMETDPIPHLKLSSQINKSLSSEEKEKEIMLRQQQLEHIFELLKRQDLKVTPDEDFKFNLLNDNECSNEEKEVELKNVFDSQLRLYGL